VVGGKENLLATGGELELVLEEEAGVVDQQVKGPTGGKELGDEGPHGGVVSEFQLEEGDRTGGLLAGDFLLQTGDGFGTLFGVTARDNDPGTTKSEDP